MTELIMDLIMILVKIAAVACLGAFTKYALPWLNEVVVPWLKEKRLYNMISYFVRAADKLAETGAIEKPDKKAYVLKQLDQKGIKATPEVEALIESAVLELDMAWENIWAIMDTVFETETETEVEVSVEEEANVADTAL